VPGRQWLAQRTRPQGDHMGLDSVLQTVEVQREAHFDPLCRRLGLVPAACAADDLYGAHCASGGFLKVYFEQDRGLCLFAIGPASDERPLCDVEAIAARFPRAHLLPDGSRRLTLSEQRRFLEDNWGALQRLFSPEQLPETRRWWRAAVAAFLQGLQGG